MSWLDEINDGTETFCLDCADGYVCETCDGTGVIFTE